ncbi:hypothetical protein MJO29_009420 [Puccinia striiformis f. sp. tritici]|nr:hypothetical protein MJO29_009420 [Puccinia striiformis f. sp. tritici]
MPTPEQGSESLASNPHLTSYPLSIVRYHLTHLHPQHTPHLNPNIITTPPKMHSTTLVIALVGLCSYMPLAMGATSTGAGMTPTPGNAPPTSKDLSKDASATPKDASAIPKDDTKDSTTTPAKDGTKDKDASKDGSKDGTTPSDGSATSGSPSGAPKMVMGDMSSGTCMCPPPTGTNPPTNPPTEKDGKPGPPTEDTPPKTDTPKTPSGAPPTAPTGDNNSTSSATSMSGNAAFITGFISVAVASLVV